MSSFTTQHLRIVSPEFAIEQLPHKASPEDDWIVLVRAPEGLTVVRAVRPLESGERWIGFSSGASAHDLDVPGMLVAIIKPLQTKGLGSAFQRSLQARVVLQRLDAPGEVAEPAPNLIDPDRAGRSDMHGETGIPSAARRTRSLRSHLPSADVAARSRSRRFAVSGHPELHALDGPAGGRARCTVSRP
ncbi:hypothetical protein ABZW11_31025 [Nonomuraea sp. NPDC004580]|uniref:hypothetical protein n=1 Tax=Nonomuraea sp. NPDC004580 TaxID=3154552 RepID=UPI00339DE375